MKRHSFGLRLTIAAILAMTMGVSARAEDTLDAARELYAAASYDEALAMLERLNAVSDAASPQLEQERALCFLALNRSEDAERAIAAVVQANPLYLPDSSAVSPRVRARFQDVRDRLVPDIARTRFARGRTAYDAKDYPAAIGHFDVVLALTASVPAANSRQLEDIRMLADGFKRLSEAALAPPTPTAVEAAPEDATFERIFDATVPDVEPPVIVKQEVPEWRPSMGTPPSAPGMIAVTIDERGQVERVDIIRSLHTGYDALLVAATQKWSYVPATHNGVKVKFKKTIRLAMR